MLQMEHPGGIFDGAMFEVGLFSKLHMPQLCRCCCCMLLSASLRATHGVMLQREHEVTPAWELACFELALPLLQHFIAGCTQHA